MKVATLHDFVRTIGGTERVLNSFLEIFPQADIYTLSTSKFAVNYLKINTLKLQVSPINNIRLLYNKNSVIQLLSPLL